MKKVICMITKDQKYAGNMVPRLKRLGYDVYVFKKVYQFFDFFNKNNIDLIVAEYKCGSCFGITILKKIYKFSQKPFIIITDEYNEKDEIFYLRHGADGYINKNGPPKLLVARIEATLRRQEIGQLNYHENEGLHVYKFLTMDRKTNTVTWKGETVELNATEFDLLYFMTQHPNKFMSRHEIHKKATGENLFGAKALDHHIKRMNIKFRQIDPDFDIFENKFGVGFRVRKQF